MAKNFEIVRNGNNIILKARVKHGPGDLHTLSMSRQEIQAARDAFRSVANMSGEAREEDMTGVDEVGILRGVRRGFRRMGKGLETYYRKGAARAAGIAVMPAAVTADLIPGPGRRPGFRTTKSAFNIIKRGI